jgi:signal transduction histidine kinase
MKPAASTHKDLQQILAMSLPQVSSFLASCTLLCIAALDQEGRILFVNQSLAKCLRLQASEISGKNITDFLTCPDGELILRRLSGEDTSSDEEILLNLVDNAQIPHTLRFRFISSDNGLLLFGEPPLSGNQALQEELMQLNNQLAVLSRENVRKGRELSRTVSELNQRTAMLEQHTIELENAEAKLRFKNSELERFIYTISHDLKSPLITISTFLDHLHTDLQSSDEASIKEDVACIQSATNKIGNLLSELLEFSQIGSDVINPVKVSLSDVIQEALSQVAGQISLHGVAVKTCKTKLQLYGNRNRLVAIWQNLVDNAVKYMGTQPRPQIKLGIKATGKETVFSVCDNGMGIENKHHEAIFGLFSKLDTGIEGTGLGLAMVKRIVETYGGRIWIESEGAGQGACFRFTLPEALPNTGYSHET